MDGNLMSPNVGVLASRWWMLVVRGIAAILFGIAAIVAPGISMLGLVLLWGAYALIDGVSNLVLAIRGARLGRRWAWLLFEGLISIAAGLVSLFWPGITAVALLAVIAFWAVVTGIAEIAAAIQLRRQIRNEWLLGLGGALSIVFGVLLFAFPGAGALALLWMIGGYAILFGVLLVGLGLRLNSWRKSAERAFPTRGTPTPAA